MAYLTQEQKDEIRRRAGERIDAMAQEFRATEAGMVDVSVAITGRGDDGRFHTIYSDRGPRWEVYRALCHEAASDWLYPESFLDEDCDDMMAAFGRIEVAAEAFGAHGYKVTERRAPRRRR